jgi:predicted transcriptional regulator
MEFQTAEDERILELDTRKRIYELVKRSAGCHHREIERRSGLSSGSVKYHLAYLARHELITEQREGNTVRYFPRSFAQDKRLLSLLRQQSSRAILLSILLHPMTNQEMIARDAGLSASTISWHLKKLEEESVVHGSRSGRTVHYTLIIDKEELIKLLITYKESFFDDLVDRVIEMWS